MSQAPSFADFRREVLVLEDLDMRLDTSGMRLSREELEALRPAMERAFADMASLEAGAVANPDEGRRVGHYWLRDPGLAPEPALREAIETTLARIKDFAARVHRGEVSPPEAERFTDLLVVGIGGSALGPQLAADALAQRDDPLVTHFLDNTDPEGIARTLGALGERLASSLVVVISKSGGTPETRNGLEESVAALRARGLDPAKRLVAVTGEGSALDERAREEGFVEVFPMWDWVGGRTSQTSAVGLLPMALAGHDVDALLEGARAMDAHTRLAEPERNPAALLALSWHVAGGGAGRRDMVVIPYKDRLLLFSRYLQQLVMESLGKREDLEGREVRQGLSVFGNKGSTDQHAYVQQLRDGLDNYFAVLIGAREDGVDQAPLEVEPGVTSGDYLLGFLLGTRRALLEDGRLVTTLTIPRVDARTLGALIALFERSVGLYASMIGINAYHQPGVEAGKKAAKAVLALQAALVNALAEEPERLDTAEGWAASVGREDDAFEALLVLEHLASDPRRGVRREGAAADPGARFGRAS